MALTLASTATARAADEAAEQVSLLRQRDAEAWAALFDEHYALVVRAAFGRVREHQVAEDIAAQVFLEAMEGIGRYRDRGKPIVAWLLTIARHRAIDWLRKAARERGEATEPSVDGPEARLTVALDALDAVTEDQRTVIHLRFVEGYSIEEVARITGRSAGAVKALQHRGLGRLRRILEPSGVQP